MQATHSELISNIKRLTVLVKSMDTPIQHHPDFPGIARAVHEGDPVAPHALGDLLDEHGFPEHFGEHARQSPEHARGVLGVTQDPELLKYAHESPGHLQSARAHRERPTYFQAGDRIYHNATDGRGWEEAHVTEIQDPVSGPWPITITHTDGTLGAIAPHEARHHAAGIPQSE